MVRFLSLLLTLLLIVPVFAVDPRIEQIRDLLSQLEAANTALTAERDELLAKLAACLGTPPVDPPVDPPTDIDFDADVVVIDQPVTVTTLHIMPHQTLLMKPGAEIIIDDIPPSTPDQSDLGVQIMGKWRTEGTGNMVIRSANPAGYRGHVMVMPGADVDITGINFEDLGRSRKDIPLNMTTNRPGRYGGVHFHRLGPDSLKQYVRDCKAFRCLSWGFVNHSSNVDFINCEVHGAFGAAFVAEAGNTRGGFYGCKAYDIDGKPITGIPIGGGFQGNKLDEISAMTENGDVGRHGHGVWSDAPMVDVVDCEVHRSKDQPYFDFASPYREIDTGHAPTTIYLKTERMGLRRNNKAHGCGGTELWFVEHPENIIEGMTCTDCILPVVDGRLTSSVKHKDLTAIGRPGVAGVGIALGGPYGANSHIINTHLENFTDAIVLPSVSFSQIDGATFTNNASDITIDRGNNDIHPNILYLKNVGNPKIKLRNYLTYAQFNELYTCTQRVHLFSPEGEYLILWKEQHPDHVLWTNPSNPPFVQGKTNQEIYDEFGVAPNGFLVPPEAIDMGSYYKVPIAAAREVQLPHRSQVNLNGIFGGTDPVGAGTRQLQFNFNGLDRIVPNVTIQPGWNAIPIEFEGHYSTIFVRGV